MDINQGFAQVIAPYLSQRHPAGKAAIPGYQDPVDMDALIGGRLGIQLNAGDMNNLYSQSLSALTNFYQKWLSEGIDLAGPVSNPYDQAEGQARKTWTELLQAHRLTGETLRQGKEAQDYMARQFVEQQLRPGDDVRSGNIGRPMSMDDVYGGTHFLPEYVVRYNRNAERRAGSPMEAQAIKQDYDQVVAYIRGLGLPEDETARQIALLTPPAEFDDRLTQAELAKKRAEVAATNRSNRGSGSGDPGFAYPEVGAVLGLIEGIESGIEEPAIRVPYEIGASPGGLPPSTLQGFSFRGTGSGAPLLDIKRDRGMYVMTFQKPADEANQQTFSVEDDGTADMIKKNGGTYTVKKDGTIQVTFSESNLIPAIAAVSSEEDFRQYVANLKKDGFLTEWDQLTRESAEIGFLVRSGRMTRAQAAELMKKRRGASWTPSAGSGGAARPYKPAGGPKSSLDLILGGTK